MRTPLINVHYYVDNVKQRQSCRSEADFHQWEACEWIRSLLNVTHNMLCEVNHTNHGYEYLLTNDKSYLLNSYPINYTRWRYMGMVHTIRVLKNVQHRNVYRIFTF